MDHTKTTNKGFPFKVYLNCPDTGNIMNYLNCYIEENIDSFFDRIYEFEKNLFIKKNNKNEVNEDDNIQIYKNISFKLDTIHDFTESRKDEGVLSTQDVFAYLDWKIIYPYKKNNFESDFFFWLLKRKEFTQLNNSTKETEYKEFDIYVTSTIENYCNLSINSNNVTDNSQNNELNIVIDASDSKVNNFKNLILFQNFYEQAKEKYCEKEIQNIHHTNKKIPSKSVERTKSVERRDITTNQLIDTIIENNRLNCKIIYPQLFDANATTGKTIKWRNYNIGKLDISDDTDEIEFKILDKTCRIVFVKNTKTVYFQIKDGDFYFNTIKIEQPNNSKNTQSLNIKDTKIIDKLESDFNKNEMELDSKNFKIKENIKIKGKNYVKTKQLNLLFYNTGPGISDLLKYYESYKNILLKEMNESVEITKYILSEMTKLDINDKYDFIEELLTYFKTTKIVKSKFYNIIYNLNIFLLQKNYTKRSKSLIYIFEKIREITSRITTGKLMKIAEEYYEPKYKKLAENIFIIKRAGDYSQIYYCKTKQTKNKEYIFSSVDRMSASFCLLEKVNFIGTIKEYGIFLKFTQNIIMDNLKVPSINCNNLYHYKTYLDSPNISKYIKFLSINFNLNYMKCYDVLFYYELVKLMLSGKDINYINEDDIKTLYKNMAFKIDTVHDFKKNRTNGIFDKDDEDKIYSILWEKIYYKNKVFGYEPGSIIDRNFLKNSIQKINKVDYENTISNDISEDNDIEDDENKEVEDEYLDTENYEIEETNEEDTDNNDLSKKKENKNLGILKNNNQQNNKKRKIEEQVDRYPKKSINLKTEVDKLKEENEKKINNKEDTINKIQYKNIDIGTALTFILENLEENFFYWLLNRQYYPMDKNERIYRLQNSLDVVFSSSIENFSEYLSKDINTLCIDASSKIISNFKNMLIVNNILKKYPDIDSLENKIKECKSNINKDIYFIEKKQGEYVFDYIKKNLSNIISDIVKLNSENMSSSNKEELINIYYNLFLMYRLCIINEISTEYIEIIFYILKYQYNLQNIVENIVENTENGKEFMNKLKILKYESWFNIVDEYQLYMLTEENIINQQIEPFYGFNINTIMKLIVILKNSDEYENILKKTFENEKERDKKFEELLTKFMRKKKRNRENKDKNDYITEKILYIYNQLETEYRIEYEDIYKDEILSRIQYETISNDTEVKFKIIPPQIFDANTSTGKHISIRKKNIEDALDGSDKFCIIDKYKKNLQLFYENKINIIELGNKFIMFFENLLKFLKIMKTYIENLTLDNYKDTVFGVINVIHSHSDEKDEGIKLIEIYTNFINKIYDTLKMFKYNKEIVDIVNDTISGFIRNIMMNMDKIKEYTDSIEKLIKSPNKETLYNFKKNSELLGYGKISTIETYYNILKRELKLYEDAKDNSQINECDIDILSSNIKSNFSESESLYKYKIEGETTNAKCSIYEISIYTKHEYPIQRVKVFNINKDEIKGEINIPNEMANIILKDVDTDYENNIFYKFIKKNTKKNIFKQNIYETYLTNKVNINEKYTIFDNLINKNYTYYCFQNKTLYCYDTGPGVSDLALFYKNYTNIYSRNIALIKNENDILQNIFDIKRYGDYSQIAYCKSNKYIYVSNDRMSASFSFIEGTEFIGPFKSFGLFLKKNVENEFSERPKSIDRMKSIERPKPFDRMKSLQRLKSVAPFSEFDNDIFEEICQI